ncbi:hypothetical protein LPJ59_000618 [Coemansia sp. RSA 2399]|nr:hypothetical protein LPJ59_000618 [Coemansia sp. RSA 2399]KAJ1904588.1 hypothetical protein LPJ81_002412 [Coemansia sp. IMI 209127]
MSESVIAKVLETAASAAVKAAHVDIFNEYGVIRPEYDDRTQSEMSPADMFFLTISLFLVGGCVSIVGGYYLNLAFRGSGAKAAVKAAGDKRPAAAANAKTKGSKAK